MEVTAYLNHLEVRNCSPETIKTYRSDLAFFGSYLKRRKLRVTQVTPAVVRDYIEQGCLGSSYR